MNQILDDQFDQSFSNTKYRWWAMRLFYVVAIVLIVTLYLLFNYSIFNDPKNFAIVLGVLLVLYGGGMVLGMGFTYQMYTKREPKDFAYYFSLYGYAALVFFSLLLSILL